MLTHLQIADSVEMLRRGCWPAALGPPPPAWNPDSEMANREICNRTLIQLEAALVSGDCDQDEVIET